MVLDAFTCTWLIHSWSSGSSPSLAQSKAVGVVSFCSHVGHDTSVPTKRQEAHTSRSADMMQSLVWLKRFYSSTVAIKWM